MTELSISGMTCASCASHVGKALRKVPGVQDAAVNLATERASISHEATVAAAQLIAAVERAGYGARIVPAAGSVDDDERERRRELRGKRSVLLLSVVLFIPALVLGMTPALQFRGSDWVMLLLCAPVWLIAGASFHRGAIAAAARGSANMDTLVSLGSSVAFGYSIYATFARLPSYFETASAIVTLVYAGKYLEAAAKSRSTAAIRGLMKLRPAMAHVRRGNETVLVPVDDVAAGDLLVVAAGERIPVDGTIVEGVSTLDVSMLTGEPMPVDVNADMAVKQGTLNGEGTLLVRADVVGAGTTLARIVEAVRTAQGSMPQVQRLADRAAGVFVPAILVIAAATFAAWNATHHAWPVSLRVAIAVLIVACPCALGLATPLAVIAGVGAAAKRGVLFRDADAVERLAGVRSVVLDKTGTLTEGKPRVTRIESSGSPSDDDLLSIAASLEAGSKHPLAQAIVEAASARNGAPLTVATNVRTQAGGGVSGSLGGTQFFAGNARFIERNVSAARIAPSNATRVIVANAGGMLGSIIFEDTLRSTAVEAVRALQERHLHVALVSGDADETVRRLADALSIDDRRSEQLPEAKAQFVIAQRERFGAVAFAGDGINDAPALACADVGIAMGAGSEIALETAHAALLSNDPLGIARARDVAQATMRTIKQNLFWAFCYNAVLVPLAACGLIHPILAAAAMGASSVFVSGNSFLLLRKRFTSDL